MATFSQLQIGDQFAFIAGDASRYEKTESGKFRGTGGYCYHSNTAEASAEVFDVKTEAERQADYDLARAKEQAERLAAQAAFDIKAKAVAKALGWKYQPWKYEHASEQRAELHGKDREVICLTGDTYGNKGRIVAYGRLPGSRGSFDITMSKDKTPEQIARDIERRLLPDYRAALEKAVAAENANKKYQDDCLANLSVVMLSIDAKWKPSSYAKERRTDSFGGVDVEGHSDGVRLKLGSMPAKLAAKLAKLYLDGTKDD